MSYCTKLADGTIVAERKSDGAPQIRGLRRMLRYCNLVISEAVRMKSRISGLLMETAVEYNQRRLRGRLFRGTDEEPGGSARVGAATAADEPSGARDVRGDSWGCLTKRVE
jgi:hypothetical protein